MGKDISAYDLPVTSTDMDDSTNMTKEIDDELKTPIPAEELFAQSQVNTEQKKSIRRNCE